MAFWSLKYLILMLGVAICSLPKLHHVVHKYNDSAISTILNIIFVLVVRNYSALSIRSSILFLLNFIE